MDDYDERREQDRLRRRRGNPRLGASVISMVATVVGFCFAKNN